MECLRFVFVPRFRSFAHLELADARYLLRVDFVDGGPGKYCVLCFLHISYVLIERLSVSCANKDTIVAVFDFDSELKRTEIQ